MPDPVKIGAVVNLPPADTVRAFDARGDLRTTVRWHEMWEEDHARAFTVAKVAKLDLLEDIRTSLADVVHNGGTFEDWKAQIVPTLQQAGWWGRVEDASLTGTNEPVLVGPRRLRTIFDTNMRVSRAAGQWARIQERKDVTPYLRYSAVMDSRTRPQHRAWHGTILPVDDPWWETHYPPCGWNCRCTVVQLAERDLGRHGWKVSPRPQAGPGRLFYRAGSAKPELVPAGIDPGFAYNPGKASMKGIAEKAVATLERESQADLAGARATLNDLVESRAFASAMSEPGTSFPVMVLDQETRGAISAASPVVTLASETFARQRLDHPEIGPEQYRQLPALGAAPDLVFQDSEQRLFLLHTSDGRWLKATTEEGDDGRPTVIDLAWADAEEVRGLQQRLELVHGSPAGMVAALISALLGLWS